MAVNRLSGSSSIYYQFFREALINSHGMGVRGKGADEATSKPLIKYPLPPLKNLQGDLIVSRSE